MAGGKTGKNTKKRRGGGKPVEGAPIARAGFSARDLKREKLAGRQARSAEILRRLAAMYPGATCALHHRSPLELLVATILSAQCTDERVNMVTPTLFARYRTARDFAEAEPRELEAIIQSTGFFRNKAKNLIGMGRVLVERFAGQVPRSMDELLTLPGVARKTANVVLGTAFGINEGVVVDTHIGRVSTRLGLAPSARDSKDAGRIELDLMNVFPREAWTDVGHYMIWHGRKVCTARKPACERCDLATLCPSAFAVNGDGDSAVAKKKALPRGRAAKEAGEGVAKRAVKRRARTSGRA